MAQKRPRLVHSVKYKLGLDMYKMDSDKNFPNLNSCITQISGTPSDDMLKVIAGQHSITQNEFETIVGKFFFPDVVPAPEVRSFAEMGALIQQAGCEKIIFDYDESDNTSNAMKTYAGVSHPTLPFYSAHLFRGIKLLYPGKITEFHFYKAIDNGNYTVAIVAVNGNDVLYLGELSELYP